LIHCNEVEQSQLRFYVFWVITVKKLEIAVVNNFLSLFFSFERLTLLISLMATVQCPISFYVSLYSFMIILYVYASGLYFVFYSARRVGVVHACGGCEAAAAQCNSIPKQPLNARTYKITRYWNELGLLLRASERTPNDTST
jgi:hypothetical protein